MRKRLILPLLTCLLLAGCGSDYPSSPEAVLKKAIEAIHNNDLNEVNRYIDLTDWDEVRNVRKLMQDNDGLLPDKVIKIINSETKELYKGGGENRCTIQTKTMRRNGTEDQLYYFLHKTESGKWKMWWGWSTYL